MKEYRGRGQLDVPVGSKTVLRKVSAIAWNITKVFQAALRNRAVRRNPEPGNHEGIQRGDLGVYLGLYLRRAGNRNGRGMMRA